MSKPLHSAGPQAEPEPAEIQEQRRRARRTALLLGALAFCIYLGFILATGLRN